MLAQKPFEQTVVKRRLPVVDRLLNWWQIAWPPALLIILIIIVWQLVAMWLVSGLEEGTFAYRQKQSLLPAPSRVLAAYIENAEIFLEAGRITLINAVIGFLIGGVVGYALALLMDQARWV